MYIEQILSDKTIEAVKKLYEQSVSPNQIVFQKTKQEFEGDLTLLVFPLAKASKKSPEETANTIGKYLQQNISEIKSYNVVKGFLNLVIDDSYWINFILSKESSAIGHQTSVKEAVMIEFSSPNTNKPLHLGHIRNILLGDSVSAIINASGKKAIRVNLVNDRGVHICKSMLAWKNWGNGETPESSGMKGDHLVGKYYVKYDQELKKEKAQLNLPEEGEFERLGSLPSGSPKASAQEAGLGRAVQDLLSKWEKGDKETLELWEKMNGWVYDGFAVTYKNLGVEFDKTYYESNTYLLGKQVVQEGLDKGIFKKKNDGSVWVDLTDDGLDEKLLLRSDGTSVYVTQDLGTAIERQKEFHFNRLVYVVGNEQEYHFKVLFLILKKLGYDWAEKLYHLSYGMVDLPSGKMKSREGTVVDADDLIAEMIETAKQKTKELGKANELSGDEANKLYKMIGLAALKYYILKVDPKKRMLFNPEESIDFNGNTGPFIQYTYARIKSVLRKSESRSPVAGYQSLHPKEKNLVKLLHDFSKIIMEAAEAYNPGHVANYAYEMAKEYNQFYHECPILKAESEEIKLFRVYLSDKVAEVIKTSLNLLGIDVPEKM